MKILKKICFGLFLAALLLYLFIIISPRIFEGFYPFGIKTAVVVTGSMEPSIGVNDFVIMKQPSDISVGDVVSYADVTSNQEVLHRVVKIDGDTLITKGDANNTEDQPIHRQQLTGVYLGKIKYLGSIIAFTTKPWVFCLAVAACLLALLFNRDKTSRIHPQRGAVN